MYEYHFGFFYSSMFSPYTHFYILENILKGLETCPLRMEIEARRKDPDITRAFFIKDEIQGNRIGLKRRLGLVRKKRALERKSLFFRYCVYLYKV